MLGALLVFVTRCITPEEAYARVEWKAIILIGSMLSLGVGDGAHRRREVSRVDSSSRSTGTRSPLWLLTVSSC